MALCSDLLVIAEDAKIGYPPARVWGSPTTSLWAHRLGPQRAKRLLFTGDCLSGAEALEWGLAIEAPPAMAGGAHRDPARADRPGAGQPAHDDEAAGQPDSLRPGSALDAGARAPSSTASPGTRAEGYAFQQRAAEAGFREAVRERTSPSATGPLDLQRLSPGLRRGRRAGRATCRRRLECAHLADVAQLARASPCHGEGRGFESLHPLLEKAPQMRGFLRSGGGTIGVSLPLGNTLGYRFS